LSNIQVASLIWYHSILLGQHFFRCSRLW
jgi:hypothetical protein